MSSIGEYTVRPKDGSESTSTVPHIFVKKPFVGCRGVFFVTKNWENFQKLYKNREKSQLG